MARFWAVVVVLAVAGGPAAAQSFDYTYEWNYQGVFLANNATLEIPAGPTFQLSVYVRETGGGNVLATNRLFGAGMRATYTDPAGSVSVANPGDIARNTAFNDESAFVAQVNNAGAGPYYAQFSEASTNTNAATVGPDANQRILLGTFTFTVNGALGSTLTAASIPNNDALSPANILGSFQGAAGGGTSIDDRIAPATLNLTPVPEPASVLAIGAVGMGAIAGLRRWRRNRTGAATPATL